MIRKGEFFNPGFREIFSGFRLIAFCGAVVVAAFATTNDWIGDRPYFNGSTPPLDPNRPVAPLMPLMPTQPEAFVVEGVRP